MHKPKRHKKAVQYKDMISKARIAFALVIVATVIGGCFYTATVWKPWSQPVARELSKNEMNQQRIELESMVAQIIQENDPAKCSELKNVSAGSSLQEVTCLNNVYTNLAEQKLDISYCEKLDNKSFPVDDCKQKIALMTAESTNDAAVCQKLKDQSLIHSCMFQYWTNKAVKQGSNQYCNSMVNTQDIVACKNDVYLQMMQDGKTVKCTEFSSDLNNDCNLFLKAITGTSSRQGCAAIHDPRIQDICMTKK